MLWVWVCSYLLLECFWLALVLPHFASLVIVAEELSDGPWDDDDGQECDQEHGDKVLRGDGRA